ncbi:MAG: amino acid adenylation domain-containing protein [Candidatus Aminicenantes bacterium]|nr:MAG: amino acid adenylation domain-containing protein [Candidatus Aminicenantes bacterium]
MPGKVIHMSYRSYMSYISKKLYKTGDLARWLLDGNIEFLGRIDHQVKIRGFRIEPAEIESRLLDRDDIKEAVVISRTDESGDKYLCAYIAAERGVQGPGHVVMPDTSKLREYLSQTLPDYMIPSFFVPVEKIPLTPNGKIDWKALPVPVKERTAAHTYTPPGNDIEKKLVTLWSMVLRTDPGIIGIDENFFHLGGHSLKGTLLAAGIEKEFNVKFPLSMLFQAPTVRAAAHFIKQAQPQIVEDIEVVEKKDYYPLSSAQKRLFFFYQFENIGTSYNTTEVIKIEGDPDKGKFERAFSLLIRRHESFRTAFLVINGDPVQRIHDEVEFEIEYHDAGRKAQSAERKEERHAPCAVRFASTIKNFIRPFDLSTAPLLRVGLLETAEKQYILMLDMHHIISDGTSLGIFIKEFTQLVEGQDLPGLRLQYKDYSEWQKREGQIEVIKKQGEYWLQQFDAEVPVLELPVDYPRPEFQSFAGRTICFQVGKEETGALKSFANNENATLYMILLASLTVLLAKLSGDEDITVGTPVASRRHMDLQPIIGMFVGTLVMRNYPAPHKTAAQFIQEVKERTLAAFENQDYPLENLVEKAAANRDTGRNPLFDVMFAVQNIDLPGFQVKGLKLESYNYENEAAIFDLFLQVFETKDTLTLSLNYCVKLFKEETVKGFITYFRKILSFLIESPQNPGKKISEIEIISEQEKEQILFDFNHTETDYPRGKTVHQLFEDQVEGTPDQIALLGQISKGAASPVHKKSSIPDQEESPGMGYLSYKELNERANQLAHLLKEKGVHPDTIVAIMVGRSVEMVIGILGILKAGGAYLPINPGYPEERKGYMLADSAVKVLVTTRSLVKEDERVRRLEVEKIFIENIPVSPVSPVAKKPPASHFQIVSSPGNLAYVIYTSGSTGMPKGVMVEHVNVVRLVKNTNYLQFHDSHCILQTGVLEFDASTFEIWGALLNGGQLVLGSKEAIITPHMLKEMILAHHITTMWMTAPLFNQLVGEDIRLFGCLRYLLVGGDVLSPSHINRVRESFPRLKIINGYGPTENTTFSTTFEIDKEYTYRIPIGKPIGNSTAYILDKNTKLQPIGIAGELIVGGDGVARGYLNNPELTAERFLNGPRITRINTKKFNQTNKKVPGKKIHRSHRSYTSYISKKIYKTGDWARWLVDGNIEFLGRLDHQVKIRGFRIEPGEIENRLLGHYDVKAAVVTVVETQDGDKSLAAYVVMASSLSEAPAKMDELKDYLSKKLPDFMIPYFIVPLEKLPLTANGKVDRKALPGPGPAAPDSRTYTPPRNRVEKILARLWAEIIGIKKEMIGIDANFFKLGGHSLRAVRLIARIHKEFNTRIPLKVLFKAPTIRGLAGYIKVAVKDECLSPSPVEKKEYYPISSIQKRLFILNQVGEVKTAYNLCRAVIIEGESGVDRQRLQRTFRLLIKRHESLRTSFAVIDNDPVQIVHEAVDFSLDFCEAGERDIQRLIDEFITPFDLNKAPLLRAKLVKFSLNKHLFLYDMHHIISDGTSMGIFLKDFMGLYKGEELPGLRIHYKDFCQWQRSSEEKENYWLDRFKGEIPGLTIFTDYPRPQVQSFAGDQVRFTFEKELYQEIVQLMRETGTTLYMVLLAFYTILLARYAGQEDIIVGTPAAGREQVDVENVIGLFMNPLAMRSYPQANKTFKEFLEEVKQTTIEAYENQGYPFGDLVEKVAVIDDLSRNPIYEAELLVQNMEMPEWKIENLTVTPYEFVYPVTQMDIALEVEEADEKIFFNLTYSTALFKRTTMEKFVNSFRQIVSVVMDNPFIKLGDIKISHRLLSLQSDVYRENQMDFEF